MQRKSHDSVCGGRADRGRRIHVLKISDIVRVVVSFADVQTDLDTLIGGIGTNGEDCDIDSRRAIRVVVTEAEIIQFLEDIGAFQAATEALVLVIETAQQPFEQVMQQIGLTFYKALIGMLIRMVFPG